ncbi:MAG TPA: protein-L-isoaspartate(D-aspartate) O-methyltransferase [Bacteroidales bacterium]|nr:protein-L-isoaspartate(D-aspartate) O-methyltransferase [Bacteroidales bacterium]
MTMTRPVDSYRHQGMRKLLVQNLRLKGISDPQVLSAMESVPRHFFFDSSFLEYAYEDKPFPIGAGQTISQPYTVAFQSQLLQVSRGDKVLEIGTGSGYQACILAEMGAKVFTIERQKTLFDRTGPYLRVVGYPTIKTFFGDGYKGLPAFAPFDRVIVTAAAPYIPDPLLEQMKPGGILVIPVGAGDVQTMTTLTKISANTYEKAEHGAFRFVPMLEDKARER